MISVADYCFDFKIRRVAVSDTNRVIAETCRAGNALVVEVTNQRLESSVQPSIPRDTGADGKDAASFKMIL